MTVHAVLPTIQSAIQVGGDQGDATRIKLDIYLTDDQLSELAGLRGHDLYLTIEEYHG